jgi:hypothetical protein
VIGIGVTLLAVWKRQTIDQYLTRRRIQAAARRQARKQAAAEAASAEAALESSAEQHSAVPASDAPVANQHGDVANTEVRHTEPAASAFANMELSPDPASPLPATLVTPAQVVPVSDAPLAPVEPPPAQESESLTSGLPEKYRAFLEVAMTQSQWSRQELEAVAEKHDLHWNETFGVITQWSRERFGEPMLVEDGYNVWVQLPII